MKIRIHDDSIRLRLNRGEVEQIGRLESVTCATHFPSGDVFSYQLSVSDAGATTTAEFREGGIEVVLSAPQAQQWALSETEVSIVVDAPIANGSLALLIEKDFECLDPRDGEDQSNRFRNPKATLMEQKA